MLQYRLFALTVVLSVVWVLSSGSIAEASNSGLKSNERTMKDKRERDRAKCCWDANVERADSWFLVFSSARKSICNMAKQATDGYTKGDY